MLPKLCACGIPDVRPALGWKEADPWRVEHLWAMVGLEAKLKMACFEEGQQSKPFLSECCEFCLCPPGAAEDPFQLKQCLRPNLLKLVRDGGFHFEPGCFLIDVAPAFLPGLESLEQALHLIYVSLTPAGSDGPILSNPLGSNDSTIRPKSFSLI